MTDFIAAFSQTDLGQELTAVCAQEVAEDKAVRLAYRIASHFEGISDDPFGVALNQARRIVRRQQIADLHRRGIMAREIAAVVGIGRATVYRVLRESHGTNS